MNRGLALLLTAALAGIGACANTTLDGNEPHTPEEIEPITPIELACDEDGNLEGTGPFEIVASGDTFGNLAIAPDGTVFATGTIDALPSRAFRVDDDGIDPFGKELWGIASMVVDRSHLITVMSSRVMPAVLVTRRDTQQRRIVSDSRMPGTISALAADDEAIYWIVQLEPPQFEEPEESERHQQLWRSMRETGESVMLAELDENYSYRELVVLNDDLFMLRDDADEGVELVRVAKNGSSAGAVEAVQTFSAAGYLRTDGKDLFLALDEVVYDETPDAVEAELRIVRVDGVTLESETLFETEAGLARDLAVGDGPYVYWIAWHVDDEKLILWRGLSDGSGAPQELGAIEASDIALTRQGEPYWIADCLFIAEDMWTQRSHIVKTTD